MKLTCQREPLLSAFQTAAAVVPNRTTKEILRNVRLSANMHGVTLFATDTEMSIRLAVEGAYADVSGSLLLLADRFGPILRELNDDELRIETDGTKIILRGQRSQFELPAANPEEYPEMPDLQMGGRYGVSPALFREIIRRTVFATETDGSRYALGGVLLEFGEDQLLGVATDGRRLARMEGKCTRLDESASTMELTPIVPARAMHLLERLLDPSEEQIQIAIVDNDFVVQTSRAMLTTRLVEGRFPKWRDVVQSPEGAVTIELPVGPLLAAARQASLVTDKDSRAIDFRFKSGTLELCGWAAEIGSADIELPVAYDGEEFVVALDHRYIVDFLKVLDPQKTVSFACKGNDAPAQLATDDGYLYVVMPMERRRKHPRVVAEELSEV